MLQKEESNVAEQEGKEYEIGVGEVSWNQKVMVDQRETLDFIQGAVGSNMKKSAVRNGL